MFSNIIATAACVLLSSTITPVTGKTFVITDYEPESQCKGKVLDKEEVPAEVCVGPIPGATVADSFITCNATTAVQNVYHSTDGTCSGDPLPLIPESFFTLNVCLAESTLQTCE